MNKNEFRVFIAAAALILSLGVLLAAFYYYKELGVKDPLSDNIKSIKSVQSVNIKEQGEKYLIEVKLNKVDDIQEPYQQVVRKVEARMDPEDYQIIIRDRRDAELQTAFKGLQPAIYEALAGNRFIWLDEEIDRQLENMHMEHRIFIDEKHLYLQISDGQSYLYEVISRDEPKARV